jgi:hypothetical protein
MCNLYSIMTLPLLFCRSHDARLIFVDNVETILAA